jgi:hypothetical protein
MRHVRPRKRVLLNAQVGKVDAVATPKRNIKFESFLNFTETVAIESPTADVTAGRRSFPYAT